MTPEQAREIMSRLAVLETQQEEREINRTERNVQRQRVEEAHVSRRSAMPNGKSVCTWW